MYELCNLEIAYQKHGAGYSYLYYKADNEGGAVLKNVAKNV